MELTRVLKEKFNYSSFRTGQRETIESILLGENTLAMLPTGTGKSLCFQLPAYILSGHVLIVSPLLSLMQDQVEQMMSRGEKRVVALNSFLSPDEKRRVFANLTYYRFIFISPEMLQIPYVLQHIKKLDIALFVVDEAHCISQWGYDFRPDYQMLGSIRHSLNDPLTLALTATATTEVRDDIKASLHLSDVYEYIGTVDRPNIALAVERVADHHEKMERLYELVQTLTPPGIIYFSSKKLTEQVTTFLTNKGIEGVMYYHGGLENEDRILIQQQFIHDQLQIICATSAFGMGINKENSRFVIHFHFPLQLETYVQEIGRAGRDGAESIAVLLYAPGDEVFQYKLAENDLPSDEQVDLYCSFSEEERQSAHLMLEMCQLTSTQLRLLSSFSEQCDRRIEQKQVKLKEYLHERRNIKRQKITEMIKWINTKACHRKNILNYFDEMRTIEVENCCSNCGLDVSIYKNRHPQAAVAALQHELGSDWEVQLTQLLTKQK